MRLHLAAGIIVVDDENAFRTGAHDGLAARPPAASSAKRSTTISPPPAYFTRLIAISVTSGAARPERSSSSPIQRANARTARRAANISLSSATRRSCPANERK
jgi:hypothetical protein